MSATYSLVPTKEQDLLSGIKANMLELIKFDNHIYQRLVECVRYIEDNELWRVDRDLDGNPFTSMTHYLPYLLNELKAAGHTDTLGVRQMRQWLAAERTLVAGGLLNWEEVQTLGIGVVEKVMQATEYDKTTGEIAEEVKPGSKKLNKAQAQELLHQVLDDRENWTVAQVAEYADEKRGVVRKRVNLNWWSKDGKYWVQNMALVVDGEYFDEPFTQEQAEQVMRILSGATSNLEAAINGTG